MTCVRGKCFQLLILKRGPELSSRCCPSSDVSSEILSCALLVVAASSAARASIMFTSSLIAFSIELLEVSVSAI